MEELGQLPMAKENISKDQNILYTPKENIWISENHEKLWENSITKIFFSNTSLFMIRLYQRNIKVFYLLSESFVGVLCLLLKKDSLFILKLVHIINEY